MQGIYFAGYRRPANKKQVKEAVAANSTVIIEATSLFGNEYDGLLSEAPDGEYHFVGPNPSTDRKFYGTIVKHNGTTKVK
jgi:hypothetical protein